MMPLSRYRIPKIARHAAFGHMNDYDLEIRSCDWVRSNVGLHEALCRLAQDLHRDIPWFALTRDAYAETTRR